MCGGGGEDGGVGGSTGRSTGALGKAIESASRKSRSLERERSGRAGREKTFGVVGSILGALSPVPGGTLIGRELGKFVGRQDIDTSATPGERGEREGPGGRDAREPTQFPTREAAAEGVQKEEQERRRALRGRQATILTSPRGVATAGPQRKTLLGQ